MTRPMSNRGGEGGFTLVELVISIAILGIVMAAVSGALMSFYSIGSYTSGRDDHSAGSMVLGSYLDRDLASATSSQLNPATSCRGGTGVVLRLRWQEYTASPTHANAPEPYPDTLFEVDYATASDAADSTPAKPRYQVERTTCSGSDASHLTVLSTTPVLQNLVAQANFGQGPSGSCASGAALSVATAPYASDQASSYSYTGCLKARTNAL